MATSNMTVILPASVTLPPHKQGNNRLTDAEKREWFDFTVFLDRFTRTSNRQRVGQRRFSWRGDFDHDVMTLATVNSIVTLTINGRSGEVESWPAFIQVTTPSDATPVGLPGSLAEDGSQMTWEEWAAVRGASLTRGSDWYVNSGATGRFLDASVLKALHALPGITVIPAWELPEEV